MSDRGPIPIPAAIRWREFRQLLLPYLTFVLVAAAAAFLWQKRAVRSAIVGQAEAVHTAVTTAKPGIVAALHVDVLQRVKQGDVVAQVVPADLEAVCAGLTADVEMLRAQLSQGSDRNLVNYQNLRLDWLRRNVDLASARVEQQLAESEYQRYAKLHTDHSVSDADFELRRSNRDALRRKVTALGTLSTDLAKEIAILKPANAEQTPADRAVSAAVFAQQKQLEALSAAAELRSPMDGIVTAIQKHPGENSAAGEPVVALGSLRPSRIVAYVRQPLNTTLKPGDMVRVASRAAHRAAAPARVLRVGTQLEIIEAALLPISSTSQRVAEYGLPLLVEIPATLILAPGEIVTITPLTAD